jgi:hypothetical protein
MGLVVTAIIIASGGVGGRAISSRQKKCQKKCVSDFGGKRLINFLRTPTSILVLRRILHRSGTNLIYILMRTRVDTTFCHFSGLELVIKIGVSFTLHRVQQCC